MKRITALQIIVFLILACVPGMTAALPEAASLVQQRDTEIRETVTQFVRQKCAGQEWESRIKRISFENHSLAKLPEGALEYEVVAPQQWEGWGAVSLAVVVRCNSRVVRNIAVRVDVEALVDMVVAQRQIEYGSVISRSDIILQRRDIATAATRQYARSLDEVAGKRARVSIKANAPVRLDLVDKVPIIKTGQMVTIIAENAVIKVTVSGRAKGSGAEGDIIPVQNLNSFKDIPARIVNDSTVQVAF